MKTQPFALSSSKGPCIVSLSNDLSLSEGFDKLSPNGISDHAA